jgi:O-antigen/teichoic acid export membrane protein
MTGSSANRVRVQELMRSGPDRRSPGFVSHAATYAIGNIARRLVGFLMLPIYTRYLTPADYGVIALLTFALSLCEPIFGARLARAIPKFYLEVTGARSKRAVIWGALGLTAAVSAVTVVALVLTRDTSAALLFGNRKYAFVLGLFAINLLTQPVEETGMTYIRMQGRSRMFLGFSMLKLVLQVSLNLLLVVHWRGGVFGVVMGGVISSTITGIVLTIYVALHERPAFEWGLTRRMLQFCWPLWLSGIAALYIGSSGAMYLRVFGSLADVGLLELALKFATVVDMLIWNPFWQHWEPMSFRYYLEEHGRRKFQVAFIVVSALMFAGGLGVSIFAEPVIRVMASKSFHAAASIVPILTLGFILNSLNAFSSFSFLLTGHTKVHTVCQYTTAVVITIAYLALVPSLGLVGAACAQCLAFGASFALVRVVAARYYDPGFNLVSLAAFLLVSLVAYVCSNVVLGTHAVGIDLLIKSLMLLIATGLIGWIAVRAIRAADGSVLEDLPWPLNRLV